MLMKWPCSGAGVDFGHGSPGLLPKYACNVKHRACPSVTIKWNNNNNNNNNNSTVAVSIKTLELYRRLRRRKPGFSIEAFTKVICDIYMVH